MVYYFNFDEPDILNYKLLYTVLGYEGKACDKDIDECSSNPCKNGATCVDEVGRYRCQCLQGFTGMDCHVSESDECVNDGGCKNGGTCVQGTCQCSPLYTGPDCGKG